MWSMWLDAINYVLTVLSSDVGLGLGFAIVISTLLLRSLLLPVSWPIAYRGFIRGKKMLRLQPDLNKLKQRFHDKPELYLQKTAELYRKHGLEILDNKSLLGAAVQLPVFMGMYQVLRKLGDGVRFLWVPNLLRPDFMLAVLVGITAAIMMAVNPDMTEQMRMFMIIVPGILAFIIAVKFSSALAIYMITSNTFSTIQTIVLRVVINRRIRSGIIKI